MAARRSVSQESLDLSFGIVLRCELLILHRLVLLLALSSAHSIDLSRIIVTTTIAVKVATDLRFFWRLVPNCHIQTAYPLTFTTSTFLDFFQQSGTCLSTLNATLSPGLARQLR